MGLTGRGAVVVDSTGIINVSLSSKIFKDTYMRSISDNPNLGSWVIKRGFSRIDDSLAAISGRSNPYDDQAGASISALLDRKIFGTQQAARNASNALAAVQAIDQAVLNVYANLAEMYTLAQKATSSLYLDGQKALMQKDFYELGEQINSIVNSLKVDGDELLTDKGRKITITLRFGSTIDIAPTDLSLKIHDYNLSTDPDSALAYISNAVTQISTYSRDISAKADRLEQMADLLQFDIVKAMGFKTTISNADLAGEIGVEVTGDIISQAVVALKVQSDVATNIALKLLDGRTTFSFG